MPIKPGATTRMRKVDPQPVHPPLDDHIFLVGRPPIGEFIGFVRARAVDGHMIDQAQLADEWRVANDRVRELEREEANLADGPPIARLPEGLQDLNEELHNDPIIQHAFRMFPTEVGIVELDRLVVFQKFINLRYVEELKELLGPEPDQRSVFRVSLSLDRIDPPVRHMQTGPNNFSFVSASNDFRFLEAPLLKPSQVRGYSSTGAVTAFLALAIGYGSNCLNAFHIENRLILNNGSHRAYALRDLGIKHAPCLVQQITRRDELEIAGVRDVHRHPERYLQTPRPPLLKDCFDPLLRKLVKVPRKHRMVKVSFGVEQTDIPAT